MRESGLLIGGGAIGLEVARHLRDDPDITVGQMLEQPAHATELEAELGSGIRVVSTLDEIDPRPDFVLECASHQAVAEYGEHFLRDGIDFGVVSIGALADQDLWDRLVRAAESGGGCLFLVPGAIAGIDALAAARVERLDEVVYTSRKPPLSWLDTPAEKQFDLASIAEATVIYRGSAREAARLYPKNANVAATIALAGIGFEKTSVTLVADPKAKGNTHHVVARGAFGELDLTVTGKPLPGNPKSSALAAYSAVRALRNRARHVCI